MEKLFVKIELERIIIIGDPVIHGSFFGQFKSCGSVDPWAKLSKAQVIYLQFIENKSVRIQHGNEVRYFMWMLKQKSEPVHNIIINPFPNYKL